METGPLKFGKDTWVGSGKPNATHNAAKRLRLKSGEAYAFVHCKNPVPAGLTVVTATYTVYAAKTADWTGTKTVKLRKVAERVPFGRMTWNNKPGVSGTSQPSVTVTGATDGQALVFDVTQHIQNTAGEPWYGWRIETDSTTAHKVYGYESDYPPVLEVTYALSPSQPVDLTPAGGAVSMQFPTFTFDAADLDNPEDMSALEIEIAASATLATDGSFATPEFNTGEVASSSPYWDSSVGVARTASVTTTNASTAITAPAGTFDTVSDVGAAISGTGIPAGATIASVQSATAATLSAAATASGTVTATITRTWAGIAAAATRYWIARYKSGDGVWGDWSDPVSFTRTDKGAVTITNPAASPNNFVAEATSPIIWTFSGTQKSWRVRILDAADPTEVVADSGKQDGTDTSWTVPKKKLKESGSYTVQVRAWDAVARVASPGDPVYAAASRAFTFAQDATVTAPTMVSAVQDGGTPFVKVTVTRATAPDSWTLLMDGEVVDADIDPADTLTAGTTHEIVFLETPPQETHTFEVRAVVNGKASPKSAAASVKTSPKGVWLLDFDRVQYVHLYGDEINGWRRTDQMAVYRPVGGSPVQIYAGSDGISGAFTGEIGAVEGRTRKAWVNDFEWMAARPTRTYQLVTRDLSIPVKIRNASVTPSPEYRGDRLFNVAHFEFFEDIT